VDVHSEWAIVDSSTIDLAIRARYWMIGKQQPCTQDVCAGHVEPSGLSTHSVTPGSHSVPVPAQKVAHSSPESPPLF
jgi:hypothetical protein